MKISISSDSVCDLSPEQLKQNNITILPLSITLGDNTYEDGIDITSEQIFDFVAKTKQLPKTSALNETNYEEFFEKQLKDCDAVIHFTISKHMSSCYDSACKAAKKFNNVFVINPANLSSGVGLLVLYACKLREQGLLPEEIVKNVEEKIPYVQASFVVERLDYLHKGGRCSALQLFGANILKIRPSIVVRNSKMEVDKKYRGKMKDVVVNYIKDKLNEYPDYEDDLCFLTYSSATDEMIEGALETLKTHGKFKNIVQTRACSTITSHCGENTLGILYISKTPIK